jgi:putative photosynthetic complex assembly protein 2
MTAHGLPILATLALWWASTGLILHLDSLDRRTYVGTMLGASAIFVVSLWFVTESASRTTAGAAYEAFACGLVAWGWQLLSFYTGYVTGPNKSPCSPDCRGLAKFVQATGASLYHELTAVLGALLLLALTYGQPNQLALWTYLILWAMHQSAKLNVFFGVPNWGEEMLPDHLAYLTSFMTRRRLNLFFPFSVTIATVVTALLFARAATPGATTIEAVGAMLLGTLMALAVLEHWFLVAPVDGNALWRAFRRRPPASGLDAARRIELELAASRAGLSAINEMHGESDASAAGPPWTHSWSADPPAVCDARTVETLLERIAAGSFGEVDCVHGFVRTKADWVCFELTDGRARMAAFAPQRAHKPLVIARGRRFDRVRLQAAFDGCAALA